jgi:hypothetical protein
MLLRVLSFLVALALVWNGVATQELPAALAAQVAVEAGDGEPLRGSVEDHQLDDQPQQTPAEVHADTPGLFHALTVAGLPVRANAAPGGPTCTALPFPYLDGPHRPPCQPVLAG